MISFFSQVASVMSLTQTCFGLGYMLGKIHDYIQLQILINIILDIDDVYVLLYYFYYDIRSSCRGVAIR